jgi:hypothetical protein
VDFDELAKRKLAFREEEARCRMEEAAEQLEQAGRRQHSDDPPSIEAENE